MKAIESILAIRQDVGGVDKDGFNKFHKYPYATHNNVIHAVRDSMNEHGLILIPTKISDIDVSIKGEKKDGFVERWTQEFRAFTLDDPEGFTFSVRCAGEDKGDKTSYKGNTGALKYAMIELFLLPTDDDPENDSKGNAPQRPAPQQAPKKPKPGVVEFRARVSELLIEAFEKPSDAATFLEGKVVENMTVVECTEIGQKLNEIIKIKKGA